ncbi:porin [Vibrio ezurae]|uniref:Putative porin n=1 Tax=Vibrio ezurae NBRC 102218 TaxID=1219080 RepID=U3CFP6_9VIBR|nr:porin [Vibrio ezurae]GAD80054.1 putative porin [Vibrio ezurae NBRC 102218]
MNKLTLTALAITSAFAVNANAADVYKGDNVSLALGGRVEARTQLSDQGKNKSVEKQADASRARLNFEAKTNITDDVVARGFVEKEFTQDSADETRYLYVAVGNENNELQFGKTDGALVQITNYTDILNTFGSEASNKSATADRADNQLLYIGSYGGLTVNAALNGGGETLQKKYFNLTTGAEEKSKQINTKIDKGYGASASYDFGVLKAGVGYAKETHENDTITHKDVKDSDNLLFSLGSDITDELYVGALYVDGSQYGDDFKGYELATSYDFTEKLTLSGTYTSSKFDSESDDRNAAALDLGYNFTDYFLTYVGVSKQFTQNEELKSLLGAKVTF